MAEQAQDMLRCSGQQSMSIHTRKITDSCRDKDCIEDLRVYLTTGSQSQLDTTPNARVRSAELITTYIDVEPVAFDGHHYCVDVTFYYRILADAVVGTVRPTTLYGLAVFSKRAVLCGEDSRAHIYSSDTRIGFPDGPSLKAADLPIAVVEVTAHNSQGRKKRCLPRRNYIFGSVTGVTAYNSPGEKSTHIQYPTYLQNCLLSYIESRQFSVNMEFENNPNIP